MPVIPGRFPNCVVAIGALTENAEEEWVASGFLFGRFAMKGVTGESTYHVYLVTNRHVVEGREALILRLNPRRGLFALPYYPQDVQSARRYGVTLVDDEGNKVWYAPTDPNVDVAVIPYPVEHLRKDEIQFSFFRSDEETADMAELLQLGVAEGHCVYVLGFPMGRIGGERNYVIVRSGSIARIQDAREGLGNEFLLDAFIFPGNSGGPVITTRLEALDERSGQVTPSAYLIGVVKGYVPYQDVAVSRQTGRPRVIFEENSGLAAVTPIDFVEEAIQLHLSSLRG